MIRRCVDRIERAPRFQKLRALWADFCELPWPCRYFIGVYLLVMAALVWPK